MPTESTKKEIKELNEHTDKAELERLKKDPYFSDDTED